MPLKFPPLAPSAFSSSPLTRAGLGASAGLPGAALNARAGGTPQPDLRGVLGLGAGFGSGFAPHFDTPANYIAKIQALFGSAIVGYWPMNEPAPTTVAGSGTVTQALTILTGVGTSFTSQVLVGDTITGAGILGFVVSVASDTSLTLSSSTAAGPVTYTITTSESIDISGRGHNGAYTGVTLAQPGIGDGQTAASFDGSTSFNNVYSAGLNTDFNGTTGTLLFWLRVSAVGVWTDGIGRFLATIAVDGNNAININRVGATGGRVNVQRISGGVNKVIGVLGLSDTGWLHMGITWDQGADQVIAYLNGAQTGATQTGNGSWSGGALGATSCVLGAANTTPALVWSGLLAHAILLNRAATATEVLTMATVP